MSNISSDSYSLSSVTRSLQQNVAGMNAKSNIVTPLLWIFLPALASTVASSIWSKDSYVTIWLLCIISLIVLAVIGIYVYLICKDKLYLLRSEHYDLASKQMDSKRGVEKKANSHTFDSINNYFVRSEEKE